MITSRLWQFTVLALMKLKALYSVMVVAIRLHPLRNEAVAAELCSRISSLKREWVVLSKMEFSLILILYSAAAAAAAAAAASRVSRQNQPISFSLSHQFVYPTCSPHFSACKKIATTNWLELHCIEMEDSNTRTHKHPSILSFISLLTLFFCS